MTLDSKALEALARAYDREDAAQRGEPDPWTLDGQDDAPLWHEERIACAEVAALAFLSALPAGDVGELVEQLQNPVPGNPQIRYRAAAAIASLSARIEALEAENERLREMLARLYQGYVNTLETGRDRILALGGMCDPVDVMEAGEPVLIAVRAALAVGDQHG